MRRDGTTERARGARVGGLPRARECTALVTRIEARGDALLEPLDEAGERRAELADDHGTRGRIGIAPVVRVEHVAGRAREQRLRGLPTSSNRLCTELDDELGRRCTT